MGARDWSGPARALTMTTGPLPVPCDLSTYTIAGFMTTTVTGHWEYDPVRDDAVPVWDKLNEALAEYGMDRILREDADVLGV